jgi:penicillin-binding protein 2
MRRDDQDRAQVFSRRALILGGGQALVLSVLAGRMYQLQIIEGETYRLQAEDNRINLQLLAPPRGRILDRFGVMLATNERTYRVILIRERAGDVDKVLARVAGLIRMSEVQMAAVLKDVKRKRGFVPVTLRDNLDWDEVAAIELNTPDLAGVSIEVGQTRRYILGGSTAHILGYVGAVSEAELTGDPLLELPGFTVGKTGFEKEHDSALRGGAGSSQVEVNAVGRVIRELSRDEGRPGNDLQATIDAGLQQMVQQRLAADLSGSAVVLDVRDGAVLALGSTPTFDPAAFARGLSAEEWRALSDDPLRPLGNKAIAGQYAPGSTFKMMVALAALKAGIEPSHTVFCSGVTTMGSARFHCWKKEGHGSLDMLGGIKNSCDVYFYDLARRVGIDAMAEMARRFGLGAAAGIDLPNEATGLMPDSQWKLSHLGESWQGGENLIAGIGQGFILTTPLQLAVMTARLANGGRAVRPHLLLGGEAPAAAMNVPPEHLALVTEGMNRVTNEAGGTAYRARIVEPGMEMAGKTGTAQVRRISAAERRAGVSKNEDLPWNRRDHALFVGFAPVSAPVYAVAVVVEHGGGGSRIAGPIAHDILLEAQLRNAASRRPASS